MPIRSSLKSCLPLLAAAVLVPGTARALVSMNDGHDKLYVTGSESFGWDSNIFANATGGGSFVTESGVKAEYTRRAGIIGVDASVGIDMGTFSNHSEENYQNPSVRAEFTKGTGRTTGSLQLYANRQNKVDLSANERNRSLNWGSELDLHYPVIERYSLTGGLSFDRQDFLNSANLVDLTSFTAKSDLLYAYSSKHDIFAGYRFRHDLSSGVSSYDDHDVSVGLRGRILAKLNGSVRVGMQERVGHGKRDGDYYSWSAQSGATWTVTKRFSVTETLIKDFKTTSTDDATDSYSGTVMANYAFNSEWSVSAGIAGGHEKYIDTAARGRHDTYYSDHLNLDYVMNEHFKASIGYTYMENWSTLSYADFVRHSFMLSLSSKW